MQIEVYSVRSFTGHAIKSKLEAALAEQNLPYEVHEKHQVDDFIKAGLTSVPALRIGRKIIHHHDDTSLDETIQKAIDIILHNMARSILVPIDFSPESIHALRYARMIADKMDIGITVLHVHQTLFDPVTGSAFDMEMMKQNRKRLDEILVEEGWDKMQAHDHVPIQTAFESGDAAFHINRYAQENDAEMIIMSTKAEDSLVKKFLGSVSLDVGREVNKPVIVVPPDAPIKFPGKMTIGFTEDLLKGKLLDYLLDFGCEFDIIADFVYVSGDDHRFEQLKQELQQRLILHKRDLSGFNIRSLPYVKDQVHETLKTYAVENHAGLLIAVTKHRNFFESLFHSSVSKKLLSHPVLPVMVLHVN